MQYLAHGPHLDSRQVFLEPGRAAAHDISADSQLVWIGRCRLIHIVSHHLRKLLATGGVAGRIATWNLERPSRRSWKRLPRQRARMAEVDADIWVLTETRASIAPGDGFHGRHTPPHPLLRERHSELPLVVAVDFNQDRDGSGWYGTHHGRQLLTDALDGAELICASAEDVVATGRLRAHHLVDHIAICSRWAVRSDLTLHCWEHIDIDGTRLSDHPTVALEVVPAS